MTSTECEACPTGNCTDCPRKTPRWYPEQPPESTPLVAELLKPVEVFRRGANDGRGLAWELAQERNELCTRAAAVIEHLERANAGLRERLAKKKAELDRFDEVIDDLHVAESCINPLEDLKRAIIALKSRAEKAEQQLADMQKFRDTLIEEVERVRQYNHEAIAYLHDANREAAALRSQLAERDARDDALFMELADDGWLMHGPEGMDEVQQRLFERVKLTAEYQRRASAAGKEPE